MLARGAKKRAESAAQAERSGQGGGASRNPGDAEARQGPGRWALSSWRVRTRLVALIVIPTVIAVALGGLRINESFADWRTHERIEETATLGMAVSQLAYELGHERLLTAAYLADSSRDRGDERAEQMEVVDETAQVVFSLADDLEDPGSDLARSKLENALDGIEEQNLTQLRDEATSLTVQSAVTRYRQVITPLLSFIEEIAEGTDQPQLSESVRTFSATTKAQEHLSYESALMLNALLTGDLSGASQDAIASARSSHDNEIQNFMSTATVDERMHFVELFSGSEISEMGTTRLRAMMRARTEQSLGELSTQESADRYQESAEASNALLHSVAASGSHMNEVLGVDRDVHEAVAERGSAAQGSFGSWVAEEAAALRDDARQSAILESSAIAFVVLLVFGITLVVARSMVRPLRRLRESALRVAEQDLPDAIQHMRETEGGRATPQIAPTPVHSSDEIGEVARSFDEVHTVALRLASDEASLRSNVNAMFVNLSRRSQTLVERQLRLIEGLEQSEQDSDRLGDLFQLDHLATRMRRNNENLLVLSGQENTRKWSQPVPLVDLLRGAISEVEHYERVNVRAPSHIQVLGRPTNDLIHLVAELVENATSFSPHDAPVLVTAQALDSGDVRLEVTDSGIGMPPEELEAINERLAQPPVIDVSVSRRMGLFVVGRLAARHGIHVRLSQAQGGGITAMAVLPADLLISPDRAGPDRGAGIGRSPVPDTYAEATAAFAATPAPPEPSSDWQAPEPERGVWEQRDKPNGLPQRPSSPGAAGAAREERPQEEHPPSGQDLWTRPSAPEDQVQSAAGAEDPSAVWQQPQQPQQPQQWPAEHEAGSGAGSGAPQQPQQWQGPVSGESSGARGSVFQPSDSGQHRPGEQVQSAAGAEDPSAVWQQPQQPQQPQQWPAEHEAGSGPGSGAPQQPQQWQGPVSGESSGARGSVFQPSDSGQHRPGEQVQSAAGAEDSSAVWQQPQQPQRPQQPTEWPTGAQPSAYQPTEDATPPGRPADPPPPAATTPPGTGDHTGRPAEQGHSSGEPSAASWNRPPEQPNEPLRRARIGSQFEVREGYGSTAHLSSRNPGSSSASHNTVLPQTPDAGGQPPQLPIYDAIESNWFRRRTVRPATAPETGPMQAMQPEPEQQPQPPRPGGHPGASDQQPQAAPQAEVPDPQGNGAAAAGAEPPAEETWHSQADAGWQAAEVVNQPSASGITHAGLPKRVPKANLVPGAAPDPATQQQLPSRSAEQVRSRLAGLQRGVRQGRQDSAGGDRQQE
ncbi:nitrate- and nitrite sensing domain-containing protein [Lipingzhangella sp. LS1_29]|uniref:histidine kinase n=1 Tax=Lipingzhangella rawalii TaxID=2055835 RepID=A0ABU2H432_9ACTN|nr:nitrate- and nitrite sensing domain-containing protein [Lipingzhangella rawalii]MDS1269585.1 nitrate- and nitrite sensing domain-containing protein [Lipingzhangella rawalii]